MDEKPIECENTHDWQQISNSTPLPLVIRTDQGGLSQTSIMIEIWRCQRCNNLRFFSNENH